MRGSDGDDKDYLEYTLNPGEYIATIEYYSGAIFDVVTFYSQNGTSFCFWEHYTAAAVIRLAVFHICLKIQFVYIIVASFKVAILVTMVVAEIQEERRLVAKDSCI